MEYEVGRSREEEKMKRFLGISLVIAAICGPSVLALHQKCQRSQSGSPEMQDTVALFAKGVGELATTYSDNPNRRVQQLLIESEGWRQIEDEVERFWFRDQPSHLTYDRIHGGIE
jgi:hypothetical protein